MKKEYEKFSDEEMLELRKRHTKALSLAVKSMYLMLEHNAIDGKSPDDEHTWCEEHLRPLYTEMRELIPTDDKKPKGTDLKNAMASYAISSLVRTYPKEDQITLISELPVEVVIAALLKQRGIDIDDLNDEFKMDSDDKDEDWS